MSRDIEILFEDNHVIAVNKPAMILTQPSGTAQDNLEDRVKEWIKRRDNKPGNVYLHVLHRLDKPVSGVVLFAKTSKALSRLQAAMRNRELTKVYVAQVAPPPKEVEGVLTHWLWHDDYQARVVSDDFPEAKWCQLRYRVLGVVEGVATVEVALLTGRYHQIRAQFSAIGSPIIGDAKYGSTRRHRGAGIALHHKRLVFPHPVKGEMVEVVAFEK